MADGRDLIFVSYSRSEHVWRDRLRTFLEPYAEEHGLTIWADVYEVQVGDDWRRDTRHALARTRLAVFLVSQAFLMSRFIQEEEVPPLLTAADQDDVRVCCVPVSSFAAGTSCARRLDRFQWTRPPDSPLDLLTSDAEWKRALVEIAEALRKAMPRLPQRKPVPAPSPGADNGAPLARAGTAGELVGVPLHRPHYLPRTDEVARLRTLLLVEGEQTVGITATPYAVGLRGQGGIGKTELAVEVARDEEVRRAFPDGIHWVTLGQAPDLVGLQRELLGQAGSNAAAVTSVRDGRSELARCFGERVTLLVLDDIWDRAHVEAFHVLGSRGRYLLTTRDGGVLTALGARELALAVLPPLQARELLAQWADIARDAMPDVASAIAAECGHLPLALSLAGAQVRDGTPWEDVRKALAGGRLTFLDHPYGSVFAAIQTSVDALTAEEKARYLELAVFPENVQVPARTVARLWHATAGLDETASSYLLTRLAGRGLLYRAASGAVFLHDLQQDYVRLCADSLPALHKLLVDVHRSLPPDAGPESLVLPEDEPYLWEWVAYHLVEGGRREELRACLLSYRWLQAKLEALGVQAVRRDFVWFERDPAVARIEAGVRQGSHVLAGAPRQLAAQLVGRLPRGTCEEVDRLIEQAADPGVPALLPCAPSLSPSGPALIEVLPGHGDAVNAVAVTPDGTRVVSGGDDGTVRVWALATGAEVARLSGHDRGVGAVAVTPDGARVVSWGLDRTVRVWALPSGVELARLADHDGGVTTVAVTPDGTRMVSGGEDGTVRVWALPGGAELARLADHDGGVTTVAVTPDGTRVVSGGEDRSVRVWAPAPGSEVARLTGHDGRVGALAVTLDGTRVVSGGDDRTVRVWSLAPEAEIAYLTRHDRWVRAVAVTPDGTGVVSGGEDGTVRVWALATGAEVACLKGHDDLVRAVAVTPDGTRVVSGGDDRTVRVWALATGAEVACLKGHDDWVMAVVVTPDGTRVVSGGADGTVRVWALATGAEVSRLTGHDGGVAAVAITPDGTRAVSGGEDGSVRVWALATGAEVARLIGHDDLVRAVAVTPDGTRAVSGGEDGTVRVWALATGAEVARLAGHDGGVGTVAVTPDGTRAVSGGDDYTVRVWDLGAHDDPQTEPIAVLMLDAMVTTVAAATPELYVVGDAVGTIHFVELVGCAPSGSSSRQTGV